MMQNPSPENPVPLAFEVIDALVVTSKMGTDAVYLRTKFPSPFPPEVDHEPLLVKFDTRKNTGVDYVREHFGIEPRVVST